MRIHAYDQCPPVVDARWGMCGRVCEMMSVATVVVLHGNGERRLWALTTVESCFFFFQAEDGIRYLTVTGVQTCALPISGQLLSVGVGGEVLDIVPADPTPTAPPLRAAQKLQATLPGRLQHVWQAVRIDRKSVV